MSPTAGIPWQDVAAPPEDAVTRRFWEATRERRLVLQTCPTCSTVQHPPRSVCLGCLGEDFEWVEASGRATIDSFTEIQRAPRNDVKTPYVLARVRLAEGPILLTRIEGLAVNAHLHCDQPVRLDWTRLSDGRALPVFSPISNPMEG